MRLTNRDHIRFREARSFAQNANDRILRRWSIDDRTDRFGDETRQYIARYSILLLTRVNKRSWKILLRQHQNLAAVINPRKNVDRLMRPLDQLPNLTPLFITMRGELQKLRRRHHFVPC